MMITDLPNELFQHILLECIRVRGWKRAMRLRLVNKLFSTQIMDVIFTSKCLDDMFVDYKSERDLQRSWPPFTAAYLQHRVATENANGLPALLSLCRIANHLSEQDGPQPGPSKDSDRNLSAICDAVAKRGAIHLAFSKAYILTTLGYNIALYGAALVTGHIALAKSLDDSGKYEWYHNSLFGPHDKLVFEIGLSKTLDLHDSCVLSHIAYAARLGDINLVRSLYEDNLPFTDLIDSSFISLDSINSWFDTPSVEVFDYVMGIIDKIDCLRGCFPRQSLLQRVLHTCAYYGWVQMATKLLDMGASVEGYFKGRKRKKVRMGEGQHGKPLFCALRMGRAEVAALLIERGASVDHVLAPPISKGRTDLVKMLLDDGADPNKGSPHPLVTAVCAEHPRIFEMLLERGAEFSQKVKAECVKRAKSDGFELDLGFWESRATDFLVRYMQTSRNQYGVLDGMDD
ncbi:ankyrin [Polyplosphaeria fusca]|uniref:Ankyrin n=1 Tax=Polyplosphaeria fusca TaxID=682080 RepID=A0A9P4QNP6_9PLEO|nr:ankyrin [Polyplosphaeria fusca]